MYNILGPKHRQRFLCEARIDKFNYIGVGNSTNKKDAQSNAARDYINYLVREGHVNSAEVPLECVSAGDTAADVSEMKPGSFSGPKPVFQEGMGPNEMGQAYRPYRDDNRSGPWDYKDRIQEQVKVEDAEDLDVNAGIHGNWTVENAKSKLHQFLQSSKINSDYKYTSVGPDHTRYERKYLSYLKKYIRVLNLVNKNKLS